MFKTINGTGRYLQVQGGMPSTTYINTSSGLMNVGDMRYNTNNQSMELYDGYTWKEINMGHVGIGLTPEAERLLDWARQKMMEELELDALAEKSPTIKDLVDQIKEKKEQIRVVQTLMKADVKV